MKNYKVRATRRFLDSVDHVERKINEVFDCTKERYEFLVSCNNAVELVGIQKTIDEVVKEDKIEEVKEIVKEKPIKKQNNNKKKSK